MDDGSPQFRPLARTSSLIYCGLLLCAFVSPSASWGQPFGGRTASIDASKAAPSPSGPCVIPPDGRWRAYPQGLIQYPERGFFDPARNLFILVHPDDPELQVLDYSSDLAQWGFACAVGTPPSFIADIVVDGDDAFVLGTGRLTPGGPPKWGIWELQLAPSFQWRRLDAGLSDQAAGSQLFIDHRRERFLVFTGGGNYYRKLVSLSLASPSEVVPVPLLPQGFAQYVFDERAALDPVGERLIVFGGAIETCHHGCFTSYTNEVSVFSLASAASLQSLPSMPAVPSPDGRSGSVLAFDARENRLLVAGGASSTPHRDVWQLSLGTLAWRKLSNESVPFLGFTGRPGAFDETRRQLLLYSNHPDDAVWAFAVDTGEWRTIAPRTLGPRKLSGPTIFDARRDRFVQHGGSYYGLANPTAISIATPTSRGAPWEMLAEGPVRAGHSGVHDAARDRFLILGGHDVQLGLYGDVWALPLDGESPWTALTIPGPAPSPRAWSFTVFDPVHDRVVMYGGVDRGPTFYSIETWALNFESGPHWTRLEPSGAAPTGGQFDLVVYDSDRHRMVFLGAGIKALSLGAQPAWQTIPYQGEFPRNLFAGGATFDDSRGTIIVVVVQGTYELTLDGVPTWRALDPAGRNPGGYDMWMAYDRGNDRAMVSYDGPAWFFERGNPALSAVIDLKRGDPGDHRGPQSAAPLRVVLHGSPELDVSTVDRTTLRIAGVPPKSIGPNGAHQETDLDHDGYADLPMEFDYSLLREIAERGPLVLRGSTASGRLLRGSSGLTLRARVPDGPVAIAGSEQASFRAAFRDGRLTVHLDDIAEGESVLECFDVLGRRLASRILHKPDALPMEISFPESANWSAGLTFVRLRTGATVLAARAIRF